MVKNKMKQNLLQSLCSRRQLLRTLTVGAGGLAFSSGVDRLVKKGGPYAWAAETASKPKRLLVIYNPNGIRYENKGRDWLSWGEGETGFELSDITKPLSGIRDQLVFFENLSFGMSAAWGDTHRGGRKAALTAARLLPISGQSDLANGKPAGPSIDQFLGQSLGRQVTPSWPSLVMNLLGYGASSEISFDKNGNRVTPYESPWSVYDKMFADLVGASPSEKPDPTILQNRLRRQGVLDVVRQDLARFRRRLPVEDRQRADAQLDAIRTLEERLAEPSPPVDSCHSTDIPELAAAVDPRETKTFPQILRATSDLITAAFACDLTRFAVIEARSSFKRVPSDFPPINGAHYEHHYSHEDPPQFAQIKAFYMKEVAYIAERLKAIPEGPNTGGTMLDNTIILWTTEISTGHTHERLPWMTVGGKNLGVRTGRALRLPRYFKNPVDDPTRDYEGYPHRRLMTSIIQAVGGNPAGFGDPTIPGDAMEGFRA